jgi:hypothetical protein
VQLEGKMGVKPADAQDATEEAKELYKELYRMQYNERADQEVRSAVLLWELCGRGLSVRGF